MKRTSLRACAGLVVLAGSLATSSALFAVPRTQDPSAQSDNSKQNRDQSSPTADKQKSNPTDRGLPQKIRKSIMSDKDLSTYAHNFKIIAQNGKVTLLLPVRSDD